MRLHHRYPSLLLHTFFTTLIKDRLCLRRADRALPLFCSLCGAALLQGPSGLHGFRLPRLFVLSLVCLRGR